MEGHQRAIMGQMSVEEIYQDQKAFSKRVFEVATIDLMLMGLELISYTLKDITDNVDSAKANVKAAVFLSDGINTFNDIIGWVYFVAWSVSFYPQIYINFKRKR